MVDEDEDEIIEHVEAPFNKPPVNHLEKEEDFSFNSNKIESKRAPNEIITSSEAID